MEEQSREEIEHRAALEERLRESERKLRAIFDHAFEFIGLLTPDGTLLRANRAALDFAGVDESDVAGRPFWETPWWRHSRGMQDKIQAAVASASRGRFVRFESTHSALDATLVYLDFSLNPVVDESGQVTLLIAEGRDVTDRKRAEQALEDSLRLQMEAEKLAATGRMAAQIAHEINNPLAGIGNAFRLVKDAIPREHPHHKYVERIEKEIDRIANIVRQMFNLHRQDQDAIREVSVAGTVEEVVAMLEPACRQHKVSVVIRASDPSLVALLPEGALRQILFNLLANAIEASPEGATVKIGVRRSEDNLCVSVSDEGSGIPEEVRPRVFEPFFSTKRNVAGAGLGLGLFLSKRLAERLHGSLEFQSEPGKGCVFHLVLPIKLAQGASP